MKQGLFGERLSPFLFLSVLSIPLLVSCKDYSCGGKETPVPPVEPKLERLEVSPAEASIPAGDSQKFTATGVYDDGSRKDVTHLADWSCTDYQVATVGNEGAGKGIAKGLSQGSTTIAATYQDMTGMASLSVTEPVLREILIEPKDPSVPRGAAQQFTATGRYSDGSTRDLTALADWASSSESVATVSNAEGSKGLAAAVAEGTSTISATYGGLTGSTIITVTPPKLVSIAVQPPNPTVVRGLAQQFNATGTYTDQSTRDVTAEATWTSSDEAVATVSNAEGSKGLAATLSTGTTTIAAALDDVSGSTNLTVRERQLIAVEVAPTNPSIALGTTQQFAATARYDDNTTENVTADAAWSSSKESVATVSNAEGSEGLATSVAVGTATITAAFGGKSGSTTLTVRNKEVVSIAVTPTNPTIVANATQQFTATATFTDKSTQDVTADATWTSSVVQAATVSNAAGSKGLATGVAPGSTEISAAFGGKSGSTTLTVQEDLLVSIAVTPENPAVPLGATQQFTAMGTYQSGTKRDLTTQADWTSSSEAVATISNAAGSKGLATTKSLGSTTISAAFGDKSGSTTLTVVEDRLVSIAVTPANPSIALGTKQQFAATGTYLSGKTRDITTEAAWTSSSEAVATVSNAAGSKGLAASVAVGTTTISAAQGAVSGSTTLTVRDKEPDFIVVIPENPRIPLGSAQQFTATVTFTDRSTQEITLEATWSSSQEAVATVSNAAGSKGLATSVALGETTISASYRGKSGSTTLTVIEDPLLSIAVTPENPSVMLGEKQQFAAMGTYQSGARRDLTKQATWGSSKESVATVSNAAGSEGLATTLAVGTTTISAAFGGKSGSTELTVAPPVPRFRRCDPNQDLENDIADGVWIMLELFQPGWPQPCALASDCNDTGSIDLADAIYCFNYQLRGGPRPPDPYPGCGTDPTPDSLPCETYPACR